MVQLVNGYPCHNPADAALARRGINPAAKAAAPDAAKAAASDAARSAAPVEKAKSSVAAPDLSRVGRGRFVDIIA